MRNGRITNLFKVGTAHGLAHRHEKKTFADRGGIVGEGFAMNPVSGFHIGSMVKDQHPQELFAHS
jgi:hypothetical protein